MIETTQALLQVANKHLADHLAEYSKGGEARIYEGSLSWRLLDALTASHDPGCGVVLGRITVSGEVENFATTFAIGQVEEDFEQPTGVYTYRVIAEPDPFSRTA